MTAFSLPAALRSQIEAETRDGFPRECCGLIEGVRTATTFEAVALHPARNAASALDRFEIDPADHFAALRRARASGREIIGCYHSHPNGTPEPSRHDRAGAVEDDFAWVVVAVTSSGLPVLRAFVFRGGSFVPLVLTTRETAG